MKVLNICVPNANIFHSWLCALKTCSYHLCRTAYMCCILVILTVYYVIHACNISQENSVNGVRMWLDREEEPGRLLTILILFVLYMKASRRIRLLFTLLVGPILAHSCWVHIFSCLSRERTIHYMIVLIPTVLLPYALVSNSYLVMIFFIHIIHEKFEFTSHAHSQSFANITHTLLTWLRIYRIVILLLSRKNQAQMKNLWCSFVPQHSSTFGSRFGTVRLGHRLS